VALKASHDDIARRAYDIYIRNGSQSGESDQNWQRAEEELEDEGTEAFAEQDSTGGILPAPDAVSTPAENASAEGSPSSERRKGSWWHRRAARSQ
jgi:hypothetical protein